MTKTKKSKRRCAKNYIQRAIGFIEKIRDEYYVIRWDGSQSSQELKKGEFFLMQNETLEDIPDLKLLDTEVLTDGGATAHVIRFDTEAFLAGSIPAPFFGSLVLFYFSPDGAVLTRTRDGRGGVVGNSPGSIMAPAFGWLSS